MGSHILYPTYAVGAGRDGDDVSEAPDALSPDRSVLAVWLATLARPECILPGGAAARRVISPPQEPRSRPSSPDCAFLCHFVAAAATPHQAGGRPAVCDWHARGFSPAARDDPVLMAVVALMKRW